MLGGCGDGGRRHRMVMVGYVLDIHFVVPVLVRTGVDEGVE